MRAANISGLRIKQAREFLGWDQNEFAAALQVDFQIKLDQSDISEIEPEQGEARQATEDRYAKGLNFLICY